MLQRRHLLVGLFLTLLFLSLACAKKLSELEPYPCANDGSCPDGRACLPGNVCGPAVLDSICREGKTNCGTATPGGQCSLGVCGQPCDGSRLTCPDGRVCSIQPGAGGTGACLADCGDDKPCPAHLVCRDLEVREGKVVRACVAPTAVSTIGAVCSKTEECTAQGARLTCFAGVCAPSCESAKDCAPGFLCPPGGGGCVHDCSTDPNACEKDQSCEPLWAQGLRGCVGKSRTVDACASVEVLGTCTGLCGSDLDQTVKCADGNFCPSGATCGTTDCNCSNMRSCTGEKCPSSGCPTRGFWCAPDSSKANCGDSVTKMAVTCKCKDGRALLSLCGSRATCEQRCQDECDLVKQDCKLPGTKCATVASNDEPPRNLCIPLAANPKKPGDVCARSGEGKTGVDDCGPGMFCSAVRVDTNGQNVELRCRKHCDLSQSTCAADETCVPSLETIDVNGNDSMCRPRCTFPDGPECGTGAHCTFRGNACVATRGFGDAGDTCRNEADCKNGLACDLTTDQLICVPTCSAGRPCPSGWSCAGTTVPSGDGGTVTVDAGSTPNGVFLCQRGEQKEEK